MVDHHGKIRKIYSITPQGKVEYQNWLDTPGSPMKTRHESFLKVWFSGKNREKVAMQIRQIRDYSESLLKLFETMPLIIVAIGHYAYSAQVRLSYWILFYILAGSLSFVSLEILIGPFQKIVESSSLISNAVAFPMMVLAGTFYPISFFPIYLQDFVHVLPLYYFNQGLGDIMTRTNFGESIAHLGILAAVTVAFFILAIKLFK